MTSAEKIEHYVNQTPGFCEHGLSDQVDLDGSNLVDGKFMKIKRHFYYCHEHKRFGSFAIKEIKVAKSI